MLSRKAVYGLAAFMVGHVGHTTRIYDADVGRFAGFDRRNAVAGQGIAQGGRFSEVQLTTQRLEGRFFAGQKAVFGVVKRLIAQGYISIFISYIHCFVIRSAIGNSQVQLPKCRIVAAKIQIFNRRAAFLIRHQGEPHDWCLWLTGRRAKFIDR